MLRNYIVIAIRNLFRNKLFSIINILGLAIGMAASLLITEFIVSELSYDNFHVNHDRIFRVIIQEEKDGQVDYSDFITAAVSPSIVSEFPEAISMCRFSNPQAAYFAYHNKNYYENRVTYADSAIFSIFSFDLLAGDPESCLTEPYSVVITDEMSKKIFGDSNPVGEVLRFNDETQLKITGVVARPPENSSIDFDALISFSSLYEMPGIYLDWNGGWNYESFILLAKESSPSDMQGRFEAFMEKHINYIYREAGFILSLNLQPLEEVHLYSGRDYGLEGQGRLVNLFVFSSIAIFILMIACFNFMNLSTARSVQRAKEVGIRKVVGAYRRTIIQQFLLESVLVSLVALLGSLVLVELVQPVFNDLIGVDLRLFRQSALTIILVFFAMMVFTGVLAGSYPAFFMSKFQIIRVIKGNFIQRTGKPVLRNILVVAQFTISAFLISSTLIIQDQIRYLQDKQLGFEPESVFVIPLTTDKAKDGFEILKARINSIPEVISCGASTGIPGQGVTSNGYLPEGIKDPIMIHVIEADDDYLDVMKIPLVMGEGFSKESGLDSVNIIINECLMKRLGWDEPVGKTIRRGIIMKVIGVVQDFHFAPLSQDIEPLLLTQRPWDGFDNLSVKIQAGRGPETMDKIQAEWEKLFPDQSFEYFGMEEYVREAYQDVSGLRSLFIYFAILAIIVACMGLLGLASYSTGQKSKEVGIRKVFGAENNEIIFRLLRDFLKWVVIANFIALPMAWWAMDTWLQNFAYRVNISIIVFLFTLLITTGLSILTIIFQAMQLARTNPADILKDE